MPRCNPARREAIVKGEKLYWSDIPCKYGHIGWRRVQSSTCITCRQTRPRAEYGPTPETKAAYISWASKRFYTNNREKQIERTLKYKQENPGIAASHERKRQAAKLNRTPKWADESAIKEFYRNCPPGLTVDHIIPLQGDLVSGLHVHNNLQYLTREENASKNNRFEIE